MKLKSPDVDSKLLWMKSEFLRKTSAFYYIPLSLQQSKTTQDRPAKGPIWVSRASFQPVAGQAIIHTIIDAIRELGSGREIFDEPTAKSVKVQWTGYRRGAGSEDPEPNIDERGKYQRLCQDISTDTVVYFAHGGFNYTGAPAAARVLTEPLSKALGGRIVSLDYRLSPQRPFPAALIDAFIGYLSLLYPPEGAFHQPIKAEQIVFAGESAGGSLLVALLLLIRHIHRKRGGHIEQDDGTSISVPMPAGVAGIGSHFDYTFSHGNNETGRRYDFTVIPPPVGSDEAASDHIWPSQPPRSEVYCDDTMLCHPLVSAITAPSWKGFPPMLLAYSEDPMRHSGEFVAKRALEDGVVVQFHHYEHQIHVFPVFFPHFGPSRHCVQQVANFAEQCVKGKQSLRSMKVRHPPTVDEVETVETEIKFPEEVFEERLAKMQEKQAERKPWTGPKLKPAL